MSDMPVDMHIIAMDIDISYSFRRGDLSKPDANITVFWEPQRQLTQRTHLLLLRELTRFKELYKATVEHKS